MDLDVQPYLVSTFSLTRILSSPKDPKWRRQHNEIFVGLGDFDNLTADSIILVADSPGSFQFIE